MEFKIGFVMEAMCFKIISSKESKLARLSLKFTLFISMYLVDIDNLPDFYRYCIICFGFLRLVSIRYTTKFMQEFSCGCLHGQLVLSSVLGFPTSIFVDSGLLFD